MAATFIFSFDCEGKWGVADALTPQTHRSLGDELLKNAYRQLLALVDQYRVRATFAFVGLFAEPAAEFAHLRDKLQDMARRSPDYLVPALGDLGNGSRQGWHGDWALDLVASRAAGHEIAFHGVTHIPWDRMDDALNRDECALFHALTSPVGRSRTMVFPRNNVARLDAVKALGILGYRAGLERPRIANFIDEINLFPRLQSDAEITDGILAIPAGYFVNWQHGPRRLIPRAWSRMRAKLLIDRAARTGSVVHIWLHPENIAQEPDTLTRIDDILRLVREACDKGHGEVKTQAEYCIERSPARAAQESCGQASRQTTAHV